MNKPKVKPVTSEDRPKILRRWPAAVDEMVPASMVGQLLYCERSAYLSWVQREARDNAYLIEGRHVHRHADKPGGALPDPEPGGEDSAPSQARSLWLSSERLGLTARIDVVEAEADGAVVPIEYKRGSAPDIPEGAYLPAQAQVCAQALLLREHGYRCDHGAIYYAESRKRIQVELTQVLVETTLWAVARLQQLARAGEVPGPLRDDPKCPGCSLNPICLPDEVNLLRGLDGRPLEAPDPWPEEDLQGPLHPDPAGLAGSPSRDTSTAATQTPIRRLQPALDDRVPVYVTDHRQQVRLSGERLVITGSGPAVHARLSNTSQLAIFGNAQLTTQAMHALLTRDIPVTFFSAGGWYLGRASGHDSRNVELRLAQFDAASQPALCLQLARRFVASKIRNGRTLLRRNLDSADQTCLTQLTQLRRQAETASSLPALLGIEGAAARTYFQAFGHMLKAAHGQAFQFEHRNRRPPRDPINALLSLLYALLAKEYALTLATVGLDPLLGFYHQPRFGRPALALDLMEEMRPLLCDSTVLTLVNKRVVEPADFIQNQTSCGLKPTARRKVIAAYERRLSEEISHPLFGYRVSYRRVLEIQARLLSRVLSGELPHYPTFGTR